MSRHERGRRRRRAQRMYRLLVRLYPAAHRQAFGEQMVQTFGDHYCDEVEVRGGSRLRFWMAELADAGTSLLTEHAAERRARRRRAPLTEPRRRNRRECRNRRVRRRLRYRPAAGRRARVVVRTRHHQLVYRGRLAVLAMMVALVGIGLGTGTATGHLGLSVLVTVLLVAAWLGYGMRLTRRVPTGPRGDGPAPPGGASMREPRRPLPMSPAGSAARPMPDQYPPDQAVAMS